MSDKCQLLPLVVSDLDYQVGQTKLLSDLNFEVNDNGITAILGDNGAGKSLLIRILHDLLVASRGSVNWNGRNNSFETRSRQALVFQKPVLLRRTVKENIEFVLKYCRRHSGQLADSLLQSAGLSAQADQSARLLSGGEQQRLALARAMASSPEVLFLDEPSASLDPKSTQLIESSLLEISRRGIKIFLVTHDLPQAKRLCSHVLFLAEGRLVESCRADHFFEVPENPAVRGFLNQHLLSR
ncbi:MAG: tungstate transport system ATP-binding protein [Gammaproteobacteria bacterium]|jgi:tungstate transport system ATP-binding protein